MEYEKDSGITLQASDFENAILFYEDIPEIWSTDYLKYFFGWLGECGYLQKLSGVIIGRMCSPEPFEPYAKAIREVVSDKFGLTELPIMYGVNFGHSSPICVLPYGAMAELDMDDLSFTITDSGVI